MEDNKSHFLKLIDYEFNNLSDYEKYFKTNKEYLDSVYKMCLNAARRGFYSMGTFVTFRYNDPDKDHLVKYFKDLNFNVELYEPGLIKGEKREPTEEELKRAPYRHYALMLDWRE